jgi:hypothetical protein
MTKPKPKIKKSDLNPTPGTAPWEETVQGGSGLMTAPVTPNPPVDEADVVDDDQPDKDDVVREADKEAK